MEAKNPFLMIACLLQVVLFSAACNPKRGSKGPDTIYEFSALDIHGKNVSMEQYRGHVTVIVNVATYWGLTPTNYEQLQALYDEYAVSRGLRIAAFPCNQFANQEPGTNAEIEKRIKEKYGVTFDLFAKIDVNGKDAHPLWKWLKSKKGTILGRDIKWNFTKFLIDQNGHVVERYGPTDQPNKMLPKMLKLWKSDHSNDDKNIETQSAEVYNVDAADDPIVGGV
jgi:phospholipid-hydroperoxide glutathione peroxidase